MHEPTRPWGQHLILDFAGCPRHFLTDPEHIKSWVRDLVKTIEMKAFGEPSLEHFATDSYESAGYTLIQLIETSNICAHFAENLGEIYIDIFSCKRFDNDIAQALCAKYFNPSVIESTTIDRGSFPQPLAQAV